MEPNYHPLLVIAAIAVLAPLLPELAPRLRVPSVVLEILCGILVGPQVLGLVQADDATVKALSRIGLCFLFLMAGMECDLPRLWGRPLRLASLAWVASFAIALPAALLLSLAGLNLPPFLVALALTTTAIGALLPILRDAGELSREFGMLVLAAGVMGEFGPLLMLSLLPLHEGSTFLGQALVVATFAAAVGLAALFVHRARTPWASALMGRHLHKSSQLPVRAAVLLVAVLVVAAIRLGLETLIGAFAGGMIVGMVARGKEAEPFHHKLDGLGFGYLIPIFFIATGVRFDLKALFGSAAAMACVPLFLALFLLSRGLPALLYRGVLDSRGMLALAFYSAPALPVIVAINEVGLETKRMSPEVAAALVGAGLLSLIIFPQVALTARPPAPATDDVNAAH